MSNILFPSRTAIRAGLVVISNFYFIRIVPAPYKTDPVLIVNPNAVLSLPVTPEFLQSVPRGLSQVIQFACCVEY